MKKILLSAAALLATTSIVANAADLPVKAAPYVAPPVFNWTGFYIGGFVGGAFNGSNSFSAQTPSGAPVPDDILGNRTDSAFFGGGQLGYNWQFAPNWVFGIEGDIGGLSSNHNTFTNTVTGNSVSVNENWLASVTGRLGYTWGPGMIYVKGGAAFREGGGVNASLDGVPVTVNNETTGYTIGGGFEYMFAPAWSAKIEYQYYNFGNTDISVGSPVNAVGSFRADVNTVKAGINYHFNWGAPGVARY